MRRDVHSKTISARSTNAIELESSRITSRDMIVPSDDPDTSEERGRRGGRGGG